MKLSEIKVGDKLTFNPNLGSYYEVLAVYSNGIGVQHVPQGPSTKQPAVWTIYDSFLSSPHLQRYVEPPKPVPTVKPNGERWIVFRNGWADSMSTATYRLQADAERDVRSRPDRFVGLWHLTEAGDLEPVTVMEGQ